MKLHSKQYGYSLLEVLASIVILAIVSLLLFSIISNGKDQYNRQADKNQELTTISYKLKVFTQEIRKVKEVEYMNNGDSIRFMNAENPSAQKIIYDYDQSTKTLNKNNEPFLSNVESFVVTQSGLFVSDITIKIKHEKLRNPISTTISIRSSE
ncbi:PulJ/GspJ family protein [Ureibacillus chungkukjangi]|uniref:PulJ/GspJ family protein n=1 Tax=Ureibacillus chungkukjangi TaxID=1202712 RepID=UPI0020425611|nr:type II secretion system protein [Ureibacillus chungkukjangi]